MITEAVLTNWYEENASRPFPLCESTLAAEGLQLPFPVLIGMNIGVPDSVIQDREDDVQEFKEGYTLYISSVIIDSRGIDLTISVDDPEVSEEDRRAAHIFVPTQDLLDNDGKRCKYLLSPVGDKIAGLTGSVFFGPARLIQRSNGIYALTPQTGKIDPMCIHIYPDTWKGVSVNGKMLEGDLRFKAGDNIVLDFDEEGNIVIEYKHPELEGIKNRADLVSAIAARYGEPILSINGIAPDINGNLDIVPGVEENGKDASCVEVKTIEHGLVISNTCATPCCDKSSLETLVASIGVLNRRVGEVDRYLQAVNSQMNELQGELVMLKLLEQKKD